MILVLVIGARNHMWPPKRRQKIYTWYIYMGKITANLGDYILPIPPFKSVDPSSSGFLFSAHPDLGLIGFRPRSHHRFLRRTNHHGLPLLEFLCSTHGLTIQRADLKIGNFWGQRRGTNTEECSQRTYISKCPCIMVHLRTWMLDIYEYMDPMGYMLMLQKYAETAVVASTWWFQPHCKILVKIGIFPK